MKLSKQFDATLRSIWQGARRAPADKTLKALAELERAVKTRARSRKTTYLGRLAASRITLLVMKDRPVSDCLSSVEVLLESDQPSDEVLLRVGTFALHCEERGNQEVGAPYLRRALLRAERDRVAVALLDQYRAVLARLQASW